MASGQGIPSWLNARDLSPGVTGVVVKAAPGGVGGWYWFNNAASVRYLKLYNVATVPTQANTPYMTIPLPIGSGSSVGPFPSEIDFSAGISYRCTTGVADNDTGAPSAQDVQLNLYYR